MCEQRIELGQVTGKRLLIPFRHRLVQLTSLCEEQQVVRDLPGNYVLEHIAQLRGRRYEGCHIQILKADQIVRKLVTIGLHRVDIFENTVTEYRPNYTRHFQEQLLTGREQIDTTGNHTFDRIRQVER